MVDRLLGHRILRRRSTEVSLESALRGARASAALEGAEAPLEHVRSGESDDPRITGALRVSGELGTLVDTWPRAPHQVLARLHTLAAADHVPTGALGRPRTRAEPPDDVLDIGTAPGAEHIPARLKALNTLLSTPGTVPALVVSAVIHGELASLRPFGWGDGLVARAAERLTLVERGLDPKSLVPPEVGHAESAEEYAKALRNYTAGTPEGMTAWVTYCCQAITSGARDSLATCEALKRG